MTPITHLLRKHATFNMSAPGPGKPVNPNGIKPVILGLQQPQNGATSSTPSALAAGDGEEVIDPAELQRAQDQATQAKQQVALAKSQAALANQQQTHQQRMAQSSTGLNNTLFGKSVSNLVGRAAKLQASTLSHRVGDLSTKTAGTTPTPPPLKTRSGAPWPSGKPAPKPGPINFNPLTDDHHVKNVMNNGGVKLDSAGNPSTTALGFANDWGKGVGSYVKDPLHADFGGSLDAVEPSGPPQYAPGTIGSMVSQLPNAARAVGRFGLGMGQAGMGLVSYPIQAIGATGSAAKAGWNDIAQNGMNAKPFSNPYASEAVGHAVNTGKSLMSVLMNKKPTGVALNAALTFGLEPTINKVKELWAGTPKPETAPEVSVDTVGPDLMAWLEKLWSHVQPHLADPRPSQMLRQLIPSQAGAGGHEVRNLGAYFNPYMHG